jgi:hypothetical protein
MYPVNLKNECIKLKELTLPSYVAVIRISAMGNYQK